MRNFQTDFRLRGALLAALFAVSATAAVAQAQTAPPPQNVPPPRAQYVPPPPPRSPMAMRHSVASYSSACGGDFGMLGRIELERRDLADTAVDTSRYCD